MATIIDVLDAIYDELVAIATNDVGLASPDDHVGVLDRTEDIETPFLGFSWDQQVVNRGFGGNSIVTSKNFGADDTIDSIDYASFYDLIVDFGVIIDGDRPRERDKYLNYINSRFNNYVRSPTDLRSGITRVRDRGAVPDNMGAGSDVGLRSTYEIRYCWSETESIPAAETIDWGVDVDGTDAYPEHYG